MSAIREVINHCLVLCVLSYMTSLVVISAKLQIEIHESVVEARLGENVLLECQSSGSGNPAIQWLFKGKPIQEYTGGVSPGSEYRPGRLGLSSVKSRLYLDCVSARDAGDYSCVASSVNDTVSDVISLTVGRTGRVRWTKKKSCHHRNTLPARIHSWTVNMFEYSESAAVLSCRAEGHPKPDITWFDPDDKQINSHTDNYKILENQDLKIISLKWPENMGVYRCVARNDKHSTDEVSVFVYPVRSDDNDILEYNKQRHGDKQKIRET